MRAWLYFIFFQLITVSLSGQVSLEKVTSNRLDKSKWVKAELSLRKAMRKGPATAETLYLLSHYYFNATYSTFQVDSAYKYTKLSQTALSGLSPREAERLKRLPLDSIQLLLHRRRIDSAAFERAKKTNTENSYQLFIDQFEKAAQTPSAIELRDEVAFVEALKRNTWMSFESFAKKYPHSHRTPEAKERYEKLLYEEKTKDQRLRSFVRFYDQFPSSPYRAVAQKKIFELSTASGSPKAFRNFIDQYISGNWVDRAKMILYKLSQDEGSTLFDPAWLTDSIKQVEKYNSSYWVPVIKGHAFGFMSESGEEVVSPRFQQISEDYLCGAVVDPLLITSSGLMARNGKLIYSGDVRNAKPLGLGYTLVSTDSLTFVLHDTGFNVGPSGVQEAQLPSDRVLTIKQNNKWGIFSLTGLSLLPFSFDAVSAFDSLILLTKNGKKILTTPSRIAAVTEGNNFSEEFVADDVRRWGDRHYWVRNGPLEGVIDANLTFIIPLDRQLLKFASFGFVQEKDDKVFVKGVRALEGKAFTSVSEQGNWIVGVTDRKKYFLYDRSLGELLEGDSSWHQAGVSFLRSGDSTRALLPSGQRMTLLNNSGFEMMAFQDTSAWLMLEEKKKKVIYDVLSGARLFALEADQLVPVSTSLFIVSKANKKGLISFDGKTLLNTEYDAIVSVGNNSFSILKDKKFGWYNATTKILIKPAFDRNIKPYNRSTWVAFREGGFGMISADGKPITSFEWEDIRYWTDSVAWVKKNFQWMLMDLHSRKVKLDRIRNFSVINESSKEILFMVQQDNAWGVMSNRRGVVVPIQYSDIVNLGSQEAPLYFAERHIEEAAISVVVYYDQHGKIIRRQALEADELEKIYCDN
ncbi:MAG: WG repeat-containing protein [Cyclobacteriaceae bacterium]|nr:WG repeat-containing protein [Cyclobacteriaceae bacterium]